MVQKFNIGTKKPPCILLAALDWGLGHATRCIPIIRFLIKNGCEVIIAAEGKQQSLLQLEFPTLQFIHLRGYRFQYSNNRWKTIVKITAQIPGLFFSVYREHQWLKRFARQKRIDAVISDNRYGFYLRSVPSVLITHQLNIRTPFGKLLNEFVNLFNRRAIRAFDSCWVPDLADGDNFGGALSHPHRFPDARVEYIGALSRFDIPVMECQPGLVLALVSGPEPQRSIFERMICQQAGELSSGEIVLVRGLPGSADVSPLPGNFRAYNHLSTEDIARLIARAEFVVARSGYSTVMEMVTAGKKCLFIPTPGQTEQEYLASYLAGKQLCVTGSQENLRLEAMIAAAEKMQWKKLEAGSGLLEKVLKDFIERLQDTSILSPPSEG